MKTWHSFVQVKQVSLSSSIMPAGSLRSLWSTEEYFIRQRCRQQDRHQELWWSACSDQAAKEDPRPGANWHYHRLVLNRKMTIKWFHVSSGKWWNITRKKKRFCCVESCAMSIFFLWLLGCLNFHSYLEFCCDRTRTPLTQMAFLTNQET